MVVNGKVQYFKEGEKVVIVAPEKQDDKSFVGWKNEKGEIVSTDREYSFSANGGTTLTAVYGSEPLPTPSSGEDKPMPPIEEKPSTDKENVSGSVVGIAVGSGITAILVVVAVVVVIVLKNSKHKPNTQDKK